jgi:hypothetical protein
LERLEDRTAPTVAIANYNGLNFGQTGAIQALTLGGALTPPDPEGAVGPYSYVEAVNLSVAIFEPRTNGINPTTDALDDFFGVQGGLPDPNPDIFASNSFTDPQVIFDNQTQRFVVGCMEVDPGPAFGGTSSDNNSSVYDVAVSRSSNPTTLTAGDWNFYQVNTTEANEFSDFPGNLGFNGGALVVTLNEFNTANAQTVDHVLVTAINMSNLTNGVPQAQLRFYQTDFQGSSLRPTTMHDSTSPNDPMWLIQEHPGAGGLGDGQHIDVIKMTNVLSSTPIFSQPTVLAVKPYSDVSNTPPVQPDGSVVTPEIDSRILKVAEQNNLLVAAHSVSVSTTEDDAQWYVIDVSSGTPVLKQQGDVSGGNHTYITYPAIDINPAGDIGMTYMQSGTDTATDFLSMYVTGRTPSDLPGTMEAPVVAQAGQQVYEDFGPSVGSTQRAGDLSGINVDGNGNFWAINEFADNEPLPTPNAPSADWGTNITGFTLAPVADLSVTASGPATVTPGGSASYKITLTNSGPSAAQNVVWSDILPAGATSASITPVANPDGFSFTLANGAFTSAPVAVANGHQDVFTVSVVASSSLSSGAVFDDITSVASTTLDPMPYDDAATVVGSTGQGITIGTNYNAVNFAQSAALLGGVGSTPPDNEGAVGPSSFVEAINDTVAIFAPRTGTASPTTDSLDDFFGGPTAGNLPDPNPNDPFGNFYTDPAVIFDEQTQRFIVTAMEVDPGPQFEPASTGDNSSVCDIAVSKSSNPATLTKADWSFYQVNTTETNEFSDFPGNLGYNGGALVVTLNEFNTANAQNVDHVLVSAVNMSDLALGVPQANLRVYQSDYHGQSLRPATMHDSTSANDPMWLVQEHLDASGNPDGQHIDVVKMTNVLSPNPTFSPPTTLAVNAYAQVVLPLQPDGSGVTPAIDSRILKVAEQGGTLVAAQNVSNAAGNQDLIQWYRIDVSSGTPALRDQGDVGAGPNTYLYYPGIDINAAGDIGMSYIQSGTDDPNDFMSMCVTGRTPADPVGTMEAPVLAQAGQQVYEDYGPAFAVSQRAGDLSGINVDAKGTFWAINEFADDEALPTTPTDPVADPSNPAADWGTNVVSFTLPATSGSPLVITQLSPPAATENKATGKYTVATFTDANPNPNINNLTATLSWGDGQSDTLTAANGDIVQTGAGSYSVVDGHTYAEEGSGLTFSVHVVDSAGGSATASATISVADAALSDTSGTVSASGTEGLATGSIIVATFTDANPGNNSAEMTATIHWGNGSSSAGTVSYASATYTVTGSTTYAEEGSYVVTVDVVDVGSSKLTGIGKTTVTVSDASLTDTSSTVSASGVEGSATSSIVVATFTDANPGNNSANFAATIHWGNGSSSAGTVAYSSGTYTVTGSTTVDEGSYAVTVDVVDDGGSKLTGIGKTTVTVSDASLTDTSSTVSASGMEGSATSSILVATFTDANPGNNSADFTATIHWGNGNSGTGSVSYSSGTYTVTGSTTYAEEGSYAVTVDVVDDGGSKLTGIGKTTVTVSDASLTDTSSTVSASGVEGSATSSIVVATFTDANPGNNSAEMTATIHWGNGSSSAATVSFASGSYSVTGSTTYGEEGSYVVTVDVVDKGSSKLTGIGKTTVTVTDASLTDTSSTLTASGTEGSATGSIAVATFTDANPGNNSADFTATIHWGNGSSSAGTVAYSSGIYTVTGSTSVDEGSYAVTVDVVDDGGSKLTGIGKTTVTVSDASLTDTSSTVSASGMEGSATGSIAVATFIDANPGNNSADFTATIHWGNGNSGTGSVSYSSGTYTVTGSTTYAEEGSYAVTVDVVDDGGSKLTGIGKTTVTVSDASLSDTSSTVSASGTEGSATGSNIVVATFTDANPGDNSADMTATIHWGNGSSSAGTVSYASGTYTVTGSTTFAEEGTHAVAVDVVDKGGSKLTGIGKTTVTVSDASLTDTSSTVTGSGTEGSATGSIVVATFTDANPGDNSADFTATIHWGNANSTTGSVSYSRGAYTVTGSTYAEEGSYAVTVDVVDDGGSKLSGIGKTTVTVTDGALTDTSTTVSASGTEGSATGSIVAATFTDANPGDNSADFTATIDWGNGSSSAGTVTYGGGTYTVTGSTTYAEDGSYAVTANVVDDGGSKLTGIGKTTVTVSDASLTDTSSTLTASCAEGAATSSIIAATFTDANPGDNSAEMTATIHWANGNSSAGSVSYSSGTYTVTGSTTYAEEGSYAVTVDVVDVGSSKLTGIGKTTVTVNDAAMTATGKSLTTTAGVAFNGVVASFTDADPNGTLTDYSATINWGDGTSSAGTVSANNSGGFDVSGNHTETVAKAYAVSVTITDVGSSSATANSTLTVDPAAPSSITATGGNNQNATIGSPFANALQATVADKYGNLVNGASVTFTAPASGASGTFSNGNTTTTITTNTSGVASAAFTANTITGTYSVTATVPGVATPASFRLTNTLVPAAIKPTAGTPQTARVGVAFATALQAKVTDAKGNAVVGISVTFTAPASGASGTFTTGTTTITVTTNGSGVASAKFTANTTAGSYSVLATVPGVATAAVFSLTNKAAAPATITATGGSGQNTPIGSAFAKRLQATVADKYGNPVSGANVTFAAPASGASGAFTNGSTRITVSTNAAGVASAAFKANTKAGTYSVTATVSRVSPTSFTLTNNPPAAITITGGNGQSTAAGTAFASPLQVMVTDQYGNPVGNISVTFTAPPASGASGTFSNGSTRITVPTNASGVAGVKFIANKIQGTYTVTASFVYAGVTYPALFTLTNT